MKVFVLYFKNFPACPLFRMSDRSESTSQNEEYLAKYLDDAKSKVQEKCQSLAALVLDHFFVIPGLHIPNKAYLQGLYQLVREKGGLVIADEVQTGLGRIGEHMWGFQNFDIVPDIVTVQPQPLFTF